VNRFKKNRIILGSLCFLVALAFSSVLLHFLFGSSMYEGYGGLLAPSYNFLGIGVVGFLERGISFVVDAVCFGIVIFFSLEGLRYFWSAVRQ